MAFKLPQECPNCPACPDWTELDTHIATAHSELPACTATLDDDHTGGILHCSFRIGHHSEDFGDWHASKSVYPMGRTIWNDASKGATPHQDASSRDRDPSRTA